MVDTRDGSPGLVGKGSPGGAEQGHNAVVAEGQIVRLGKAGAEYWRLDRLGKMLLGRYPRLVELGGSG